MKVIVAVQFTYMYYGDFNGDNIAYDAMYISKRRCEIILHHKMIVTVTGLMQSEDAYW